jgi:hypothetical protein
MRQLALAGKAGIPWRCSFVCAAAMLIALIASPPVWAQNAVTVDCPGSGTLVNNDSAVPANFVFSVENATSGGEDVPAEFTISWHDAASSTLLSATLKQQTSGAIALSMAPNSALSYTCGASAIITYLLSASGALGDLDCGVNGSALSGALLQNFQSVPLSLALGLSATLESDSSATGSVSLSWIDQAGVSHTGQVTDFSKAFVMTVGKGQSLKYTCASADSGSWSLIFP